MQKQRKLCIFRKRFDFICQVFCLVVAGSPFETVHRNGPLFDIAQTYPRKPSCFHRYTHSNGSAWELLFTISPVGFTSPLLWSTGQYIHKGHICDNCLICTTRVWRELLAEADICYMCKTNDPWRQFEVLDFHLFDKMEALPWWEWFRNVNLYFWFCLKSALCINHSCDSFTGRASRQEELY